MPHYFYGGIMKRILQINIIALMMLLFLSPVNALNDGAYLISRSTPKTFVVGCGSTF